MNVRVCASLLGCLLAELALPAHGQVQATNTLSPVIVTAPASDDTIDPSLGARILDAKHLRGYRYSTSDTASLLKDVPGAGATAAGGVSSLPVVRGLADDRLRVQVDGMDLMAACPNHMNPALSYIDPSRVGKVTVFAGVTPVSVGGDSIGGTVQVESAPPRFAQPDQTPLLSGELGTSWRSNGNARSANLSAGAAFENFSIGYDGATTRSDNYSAARDFKPAGPGRAGGDWLSGSTVGSSAYESNNQNLRFAARHANHLLRFEVGVQDIPFEGFPNQRMDMTSNRNTSYNLRYSGVFDWGDVQARLYRQNTHHRMDMGPDRDTYGTGMPMNTQATTTGASLQANIAATDRDILRFGTEFQNYRLFDWWPPVGGSMGPNTFWNIDDGRRDRVQAFAEWEAHWQPEWTSLLGVRGGRVTTSTGQAQGYNDGLPALWGNDAAAFNAQDRSRSFALWDATALVRHTPDATRTYEFGLARKTRAPNLYQLYPWSTQAMAALMNNFAGDGNGYVGNPQLKPEAAYTASISGDWHDTGSAPDWNLTATGYYTYISNYIDAQRCMSGQCSATNGSTTTGFVLLKYTNQSAQIFGVDVSAHAVLVKGKPYGDVAVGGTLSALRGNNVTTGDGLYNLMPPSLRLSVEHRLGRWSNAIEWQGVRAKTHVSQVRNEVPTAGYGLVNLRSSYEWKQLRLDFGVDNLLNHFYYLPLGGAYLGQGSSMTSNGIAWGIPVPGRGRSINLGLSVRY